MSDGVQKVVLAYSGGLDTSVILRWLQETYRCEVVTFTADLGQGEELGPARRKAELLGVREIFVDDLREEFVRDRWSTAGGCHGTAYKRIMGNLIPVPRGYRCPVERNEPSAFRTKKRATSTLSSRRVPTRLLVTLSGLDCTRCGSATRN
jgi:Arginosuccinate synthase